MNCGMNQFIFFWSNTENEFLELPFYRASDAVNKILDLLVRSPTTYNYLAIITLPISYINGTATQVDNQTLLRDVATAPVASGMTNYLDLTRLSTPEKKIEKIKAIKLHAQTIYTTNPDRFGRVHNLDIYCELKGCFWRPRAHHLSSLLRVMSPKIVNSAMSQFVKQQISYI